MPEEAIPAAGENAEITDENDDAGQNTQAAELARWMSPGVGGIGLASFLADVGHEVPTALLPSFVTSTLGAPAAALGLIEGISDGLAGAGRFVGGALADDPGRRRAVAVGGYTTTAVLSALIGVAGNVVQVGVLRGASWAARGLRVPARNALLADVVPTGAYGRAYGFERTMDNLGAIGGPLLALGLVALFSVRTAILISVVPGLLAAAAIVFAIRQTELPDDHRTPPAADPGPRRAARRARARSRRVHRVRGRQPGRDPADPARHRPPHPAHGTQTATEIALGLYTAYNIAATLASFPPGGWPTTSGTAGPRLVITAGVAAFLAAYLIFALHARLVGSSPSRSCSPGSASVRRDRADRGRRRAGPNQLRGSAFGLLATVQACGNVPPA